MGGNRKIREQIKQGEGIHLDFKHSISDSKKIARSLSAFANTEGGALLIGVRDNGSIAGVKSDEEYYMIETASLVFCKPNVEFTHKIWNIEGKNILEINVTSGTNKPYLAPDYRDIYRAFIRVNDENFVASKIIVDVWKRKQKGFKGIKLIYDDVVEILFNEITENGSITKSQLTRITGIKSQKANTLLTNLMLMEIIDAEISESITKFIFHKNYLKDLEQ
ncbi:MAG: ATP-binding protein [Bacteroidales bacterium]|nr:ATP-binding protein [Bacteroidales bacterium]MDD4217736.1 ATP-binding protein [Bacteroidales bacterium]MDY0140445.1 ATP-binding protein [Bacteroidales bacterium]